MAASQEKAAAKPADDKKLQPDEDQPKHTRQMSKGNLMLMIENAKWFELEGDKRNEICKGALTVLEATEEQNKMFLMVGDNQCYELKMSLPSLRVNARNYVFPAEKVFYGLVLGEKTSEDEIEAFEAMLAKSTYFKAAERQTEIESKETDPEEEKKDEGPKPAGRVERTLNSGANMIEKGADSASAKIEQGADYLSRGVQNASEFAKSKLAKKDAVELSDNMKGHVGKVKFASNMAVTVSKALLSGAIVAGNKIAEGLADAMNDNDKVKDSVGTQAGPKTQATKNLAKNTLGGVVKVYDAMLSAGASLAKNTAVATSDVVRHRWGDEVGQATEDTLVSAANLVEVAANVERIGFKSIAMRGATTAGQDLLKSDEEKAAAREERAKNEPSAVTLAAAGMVINELAKTAPVSNKNPLRDVASALEEKRQEGNEQLSLDLPEEAKSKDKGTKSEDERIQKAKTLHEKHLSLD